MAWHGVLPKGLHRILHYGLFAKNACADSIARARELLSAAKPEGQPTAAAVDVAHRPVVHSNIKNPNRNDGPEHG
jgi:hypothetical protein